MRPLLLFLLLVVGMRATAVSPGRSHLVSTSRVQIEVPAGWHVSLSKTPACDPERLLTLSSAPIQVSSGGRLAAPSHDGVLVVVLMDRFAQDRPFGDLHRPEHFSVPWSKLVHVKSICGLPHAPAYARYLRANGRYIGFIIYPGSGPSARTRAQTLTTMDSIRVGK